VYRESPFGQFYGNKLLIYLICYIYLNHIAACLMFFIGKVQYEQQPHVRFDNRTWFSVFGEPSFHDYEPLLD
jgi:hypothetical protein